MPNEQEKFKQDQAVAAAIIPPMLGKALTPAEFAKGHDTVTMVFEKDVLFTPVHGTRVQYTKGVHEVPTNYENHWYLKAHGAYTYRKAAVVADVDAKADRAPRAPKAAPDANAKPEKANS